MSLESGVMLCRLNQELLPDPGNPMARTTVPFEARGAAAGVAFAAPAVSIAGPATGLHLRPALRATPGRRAQVLAACAPPRPRPPLPRRRRRRGSPFPSRALRLRAGAPPESSSLNGWRFRRGRCFEYSRLRLYGLEPPARKHRGVVVGGLKRGLCRLVLTGFRILFGALKTIAHPLAHVWFVTQLHISGNPARRKTYQSCQPFSCRVWRGRPRPRDRMQRRVSARDSMQHAGRVGRRPRNPHHTNRVTPAAPAPRTH